MTAAAAMPIIQVVLQDVIPTRVTTQGKTQYMQQLKHDFRIYYKNQQGHEYTFSATGLELTNGSQCRAYLDYIMRTMKANMADLEDDGTDNFFVKHEFGTIAKPVRDPKTSLWKSFLPFTVYTHHRT